MVKPSLLILAAGMASRYGSLKQIVGFGPAGETIMDYSIYDAIRAGFGKIVFIIRKDFAEDFKARFDAKLKGKVEVEYVFQEMDAHMNGYSVPSERSKPWGTAHAVLCAKDVTREPFAVINADDFYGKDAFVKAYEFLTKDVNPRLYAIIGYKLSNTLSDHGTVSRGVCEVDGEGYLAGINERTKIGRVNGKVMYEEDGQSVEVPENSSVSMNFWCFDQDVFDVTERMFHAFLEKHRNEPKSEFFIPIVADQYVKEGSGKVKVIPTQAQWFGVTYKEDAPVVKDSIDKLVAEGEYPSDLWG
ncbi:MAG TPA: sugar phosphate nucleotidyltransferase [Parasegetibacter sp.]